MASARADGGIVSTARDGIRFLESFMTGRLFPAEYLNEMQSHWNPIFPPMKYGLGMMQFALPRYYTMFKQVPAMVGHSGASGAVLYYVPQLDLCTFLARLTRSRGGPLTQSVGPAGNGLRAGHLNDSGRFLSISSNRHICHVSGC
jgi:CubicO group peptidase (beta-lactamase class C family)